MFLISDGRVVRASASGAVDSGLTPSRVKPMTLKLVFTTSLLDVQHLGRVHTWRFSQPDTKLHFVIADAILILFKLVSAIQKLKRLPFRTAEEVFKILKNAFTISK